MANILHYTGHAHRRALILHSEKDLKMKEIVTRSVSSNKREQHILEKFNFKKYKTIKNQRINGDDSYWYKLKI